MVMILIYYKNRKWHFCNEKVKYIQHDKEITQYIGAEGHQWWLDFEEKWEHTEILEFIPVEFPLEYQDRLVEINQLNIGDGHHEIIENFIVNEEFPEGLNHILRPLQIFKQQEEQDKYLIDLDFRQSLTEMGVDINDL